jgi:hypothetical protein
MAQMLTGAMHFNFMSHWFCNSIRFGGRRPSPRRSLSWLLGGNSAQVAVFIVRV